MKCTDGALVNEAAMKMSQGERKTQNIILPWHMGKECKIRREMWLKRKMCLSSMNLSICYESKQLASRASIPSVCR